MYTCIDSERNEEDPPPSSNILTGRMTDKHSPAPPYPHPSPKTIYIFCVTLYTYMLLTYGRVQMFFLALKPSLSQGKSFVKIPYSKN